MILDANFEDCKEIVIDAEFFEDSAQFDADFGEVTEILVASDYYTGSYDVTPRTDAQTLETKEKLMVDDVHIKAIPFYEVSNLAGGDTAYIGMMNE